MTLEDQKNSFLGKIDQLQGRIKEYEGQQSNLPENVRDCLKSNSKLLSSLKQQFILDYGRFDDTSHDFSTECNHEYNDDLPISVTGRRLIKEVEHFLMKQIQLVESAVTLNIELLEEVQNHQSNIALAKSNEDLNPPEMPEED